MSIELFVMGVIACGVLAFLISEKRDYSMFGCAGIMLILMICVFLLSAFLTFLFPFRYYR